MKKWPVYDENGCIPRTPREELPQTFEVDGQTLSLEEIERRFAGQINNVIEEEESFEAGHDELSRLFWQYEKLDMECTEEVILHILQPLVDSKDTRGFARADHRLRCSDFQRESTRAVKRMIIEGDDPQKVFLLKQWHGPELWGELYKDESTKDEARKALKAFLESYGLNPHTAAKSWVQAINEGKYKSENIITKEQVARKNMYAITALEKERPGIAEFLQKTYNLNNFARYVDSHDAWAGMLGHIFPDPLIEQYDKREDKGARYVGYVVADHDWNGAFSNYDHYWSLQRKAERNKLGLKFAETGKKIGLISRIVGMYRKHGPLNSLIIGAHGSQGTLRLGDDNDDVVKIEELVEEIREKKQGKPGDVKCIRELRACFESNACIVLNSCSVGKDEGVAQKLSDLFGVIVIASEHVGGIYDMDFTKNGPAWAYYSKSELAEDGKRSNTEEDGKTRIYYPSIGKRIAFKAKHFGRRRAA